MPRIKHSIDLDFFKTIDTEEKAYWLGMIAADGHITKSGRALYLNFSKKDLSHLLKFKRSIKSGHPIKTRSKVLNGKTFYSKRIVVGRRKFCTHLINAGIPPGAKTFILKPPTNLPKDMIRHWIRGYFDGDGSFSMNTKRPNFTFGITSVLPILEFIKDYFNLECKLNLYNIHHRKKHHKDIHRLQIRGNNQVYKIGKEIYFESKIFLERKRKVFDKLIKQRESYSDESNKRYNRVN